MDIAKFIHENDLTSFPVGVGGCRVSGINNNSCDHDVFVFDEKSGKKILKFEDESVMLHHGSLSESESKQLLQYDGMKIIQDESWELRMFLSKISEKRILLYRDFAKNSLIESLFCCQKTKESLKSTDSFGSCWQKCAAFYLSDAILSLNYQRISPSHMLELLRKLEKTQINENISTVTQTVGIERATLPLLERMLKSTMGFSDLIEKNNHSQTIQQKYDYFVTNSMLSDCYFYLGWINKENFTKIKDNLNREQDLIHILKVAFDVEADLNLVEQQANSIEKSCNSILGIL
ncbi:hypothetical protein C6990_08335 [Nitrosopumilus sp. b3]|uniref:hypothetical protein n=1 Tax=Nitrosopumilus sp. b3 TaxID=2109909 RepID=UPI0015F4E7ED|nr:hypothetical protein [Nitrosopumilus sp. b3]KAF6246633.1 hypothetical protein C6990_08335 [Nitrosopumilus sp. b3]